MKKEMRSGRVWYSPDTIEELEKIMRLVHLKELGGAVRVAEKHSERARKCNVCGKRYPKMGLAVHKIRTHEKKFWSNKKHNANTGISEV